MCTQAAHPILGSVSYPVGCREWGEVQQEVQVSGGAGSERGEIPDAFRTPSSPENKLEAPSSR